jgi:hypothetical protein
MHVFLNPLAFLPTLSLLLLPLFSACTGQAIHAYLTYLSCPYSLHALYMQCMPTSPFFHTHCPPNFFLEQNHAKCIENKRKIVFVGSSGSHWVRHFFTMIRITQYYLNIYRLYRRLYYAVLCQACPVLYIIGCFNFMFIR